MKEENIKSLTLNRATFISYVTKYYNRKTDFPNSSYYFHKKVIGNISTAKVHKDLFKDKLFLEFVYATLSTWGLDRMDGGARLVEFNIFRKSVLDNALMLEKLTNYKISEINDIERQEIKDTLSILFDSLEVMIKDVKLVGVAKALHHLLPDLAPPIDRKYTLNFFYGNNEYGEKDQKDKFMKSFDKFCLITKELNLTEKDLSNRWDTSVPKLIDNAIIGYVSNTSKKLRKKVRNAPIV